MAACGGRELVAGGRVPPARPRPAPPPRGHHAVRARAARACSRSTTSSRWSCPSTSIPVKRWFARVSIPPSARHARVIVTLTEVTRQMMVERLGVDAGPHRGDPGRHPRAHRRRGRPASGRSTCAATTASATRPFFLYPAITYPHKNHVFLVEAFAPVARQFPEARLVLTGGSAQHERALGEVVDDLGVAGQVRRLGRIPRAHLDALYHEATALVFPSRYEGFGMPVLEAMSRGCPVVAADATALPEVGGDGAVLLPLEDARRWSDELALLLTDEGHRAALGGRRVGPRADALRLADGRRAVRRGLRPGPSRRSDAVNILVLCPHFQPDVAPTGEVMTSIVDGLAGRGSPAARRHRAALVQGARPRAGLGGSAGAPRGHLLGPHHPRAPVPHRQVEHARPAPSRSAASPLLTGVMGRDRPIASRRGPRHVAARSRWARRAGRWPGPGGCRSCSTSRTSSPTWPWSWAC